MSRARPAGPRLQPIGLALKRVQVRHHQTLDAALRPYGLTLVQWDALRNLSEHPEASLHSLARLTFQTDQAFGTLARRLVARGFIARHDTSGRAVRHTITPLGREGLEKGRSVVEAALRQTLGTLRPDDLEALDRILADLLAAPREDEVRKGGGVRGPAPRDDGIN